MCLRSLRPGCPPAAVPFYPIPFHPLPAQHCSPLPAAAGPARGAPRAHPGAAPRQLFLRDLAAATTMLSGRLTRLLPLSQPPSHPCGLGGGERARARGRRAVTALGALLAESPGAEGGFEAGPRCPCGTAAALASLRSGHAVPRWLWRGCPRETGWKGGCGAARVRQARHRRTKEAMGTSSMEPPAASPAGKGLPALPLLELGR